MNKGMLLCAQDQRVLGKRILQLGHADKIWHILHGCLQCCP